MSFRPFNQNSVVACLCYAQNIWKILVSRIYCIISLIFKQLSYHNLLRSNLYNRIFYWNVFLKSNFIDYQIRTNIVFNLFNLLFKYLAITFFSCIVFSYTQNVIIIIVYESFKGLASISSINILSDTFIFLFVPWLLR